MCFRRSAPQALHQSKGELQRHGTGSVGIEGLPYNVGVANWPERENQRVFAGQEAHRG